MPHLTIHDPFLLFSSLKAGNIIPQSPIGSAARYLTYSEDKDETSWRDVHLANENIRNEGLTTHGDFNWDYCILMPMKTVLVGCPKIEISLLSTTVSRSADEGQTDQMRAAAAPLQGSHLWIFGELSDGLIGEREGLVTGAQSQGTDQFGTE